MREHLIPFNLQFFAEGEENNNEDIKTEGTKETKKEETESAGNVDNVDTDNVETFKRKGVTEFLKAIGVDTEDDLKGMVSKYREDEEKNLSKVEKLEKKIAILTKKLVEEQKTRMSYEAQIEALKLGVKTDMLEDAVIVASAKVTEDKDVKSVLMEMKKSGKSVYFENNDDEGTKGTTVTRKGRKQESVVDNSSRNDDGGEGGESKGSGIAARLFENKKKTVKSSYWT